MCAHADHATWWQQIYANLLLAVVVLATTLQCVRTCRVYDIVVIATPLSSARISFNIAGDTRPPVRLQLYQTTHTTYVHGVLQPEYFNVHTGRTQHAAAHSDQTADSIDSDIGPDTGSNIGKGGSKLEAQLLPGSIGLTAQGGQLEERFSSISVQTRYEVRDHCTALHYLVMQKNAVLGMGTQLHIPVWSATVCEQARIAHHVVLQHPLCVLKTAHARMRARVAKPCGIRK